LTTSRSLKTGSGDLVFRDVNRPQRGVKKKREEFHSAAVSESGALCGSGAA